VAVEKLTAHILKPAKVGIAVGGGGGGGGVRVRVGVGDPSILVRVIVRVGVNVIVDVSVTELVREAVNEYVGEPVGDAKTASDGTVVSVGVGVSASVAKTPTGTIVEISPISANGVKIESFQAGGVRIS
jgi:hypothetical protein